MEEVSKTGSDGIYSAFCQLKVSETVRGFENRHLHNLRQIPCRSMLYFKPTPLE